MNWDGDLHENSAGALETLVSIFPLSFKSLLMKVPLTSPLNQIRVGMSVGHSPEQAQHTGDMKKDNLTMEEKKDAHRRIGGGEADVPDIAL